MKMSSGAATVSRGTSKGKPTVSDTFRHQLQALVDVLQATNPWLVKFVNLFSCIPFDEMYCLFNVFSML